MFVGSIKQNYFLLHKRAHIPETASLRYKAEDDLAKVLKKEKEKEIRKIALKRCVLVLTSAGFMSKVSVRPDCHKSGRYANQTHTHTLTYTHTPTHTFSL